VVQVHFTPQKKATADTATLSFSKKLHRKYMGINTTLPEPPPIQQDSDLPWLVAKYTFATDTQLTSAYSDVAKGLAIFEETPRGNLGPALRQHLNIIVAEQQRRGRATA
jgi:hypothetical protein